jgi:hypothetical protein
MPAGDSTEATIIKEVDVIILNSLSAQAIFILQNFAHVTIILLFLVCHLYASFPI